MMRELETGFTAVGEWTRIIQNGDFQKIAATLESLIVNVVQKGRMRICTTLNNLAEQKRVLPKLNDFVRQYNGDRPAVDFPIPPSLATKVAEAAATRKVFIHPDTTINYCFRAAPVGSFLDPQSPVFSALACVLESEFLYDRLRFDLGAYDVFA
jgi:Zn-dependent M16 (insulinase) family peptidase